MRTSVLSTEELREFPLVGSSTYLENSKFSGLVSLPFGIPTVFSRLAIQLSETDLGDRRFGRFRFLALGVTAVREGWLLYSPLFRSQQPFFRLVDFVRAGCLLLVSI